MLTPTESTSDAVVRKIHDKLNRVDFHWFAVHTSPHQECMLAEMMRQRLGESTNILEVYCPTHTSVKVIKEGKKATAPLFARYVFALSTHEALVRFLDKYYPGGSVMYNHRPLHEEALSTPLTIPEAQMRAFMDFNDNYAEHVLVLERPYTDYAFNAKTGEPNEMVRVVDGPLAGREGYLARFRGDRRLVFQLKALDSDKYYTLSIPHVWDFHVERLHNAEGDRLSMATEKPRAADLLLGILQGRDSDADAPGLLLHIIDALLKKPSLTALCQSLRKGGHQGVADAIAHLTPEEARLVFVLVRYAREDPGYVKENWGDFAFRPFLTPTAGVAVPEGAREALLRHEDYTEVMRAVDITEQVYDPKEQRARTAVTPYYAHVGILSQEEDAGVTLFLNWHAFLDKYYHTDGKASERLVEESFRDYAPSLYKVLTDETSPVRVVRDLRVGNRALHALAIHVAADDDAALSAAKEELVTTGIRICQEINTTTHLAVWRRFLRTVWLHT